MLEYGEFKKILDLNTTLAEYLKTCPEDEREEVQMRMDSNMHALKLMANKIEDSETKEAFLSCIQSLSSNIQICEENIIKKRLPGEKNRDLVDDELLKNSKVLRKITEDFKACLKNDEKVVDKISNKMTKNSVENTKSMQIFENNGVFIKSSSFLSVSLLIFVFVYILIRFS